MLWLFYSPLSYRMGFAQRQTLVLQELQLRFLRLAVCLTLIPLDTAIASGKADTEVNKGFTRLLYCIFSHNNNLSSNLLACIRRFQVFAMTTNDRTPCFFFHIKSVDTKSLKTIYFYYINMTRLSDADDPTEAFILDHVR